MASLRAALFVFHLALFYFLVYGENVNFDLATSGSNSKRRSRVNGLSLFSLSTGVISLIGLVANYFQFEQAGQSGLFWLLLVLAVLLAVVGACVFVVQWLQDRRLRAKLISQQERISFLLELRDELQGCESAKALSVQIKPRAKIVALQKQEGVVKAILNIGKKEGLRIGTPLLVVRVDDNTPDGPRVEQRIGLLKVSLVQMGNSLSHADVINTFDQTFWTEAQKRLSKERSIDPPRNFIVPYITPNFEKLTLTELSTIRKSLDMIIRQVTGVDQPATEQEDNE